MTKQQQEGAGQDDYCWSVEWTLSYMPLSCSPGLLLSAGFKGFKEGRRRRTRLWKQGRCVCPCESCCGLAISVPDPDH
ncbi:unnamed protein product [Arctogadus glacialis]